MKEKMLQYLKFYHFCGRDEEIIKEFIGDFFKHCQPERLNPEDTSVKTYYRSDDGIYEKLESCICDSPNTANK